MFVCVVVVVVLMRVCLFVTDRVLVCGGCCLFVVVGVWLFACVCVCGLEVCVCVCEWLIV